MQAGYFITAWNDIKNTPNWFGKLLLLSLVACIPVFGIIVVYGYLYGWARNIAWGVHSPLPQHIFGNEDGKLYSRGFFVLVISIVCALLPFAIEFVFGFITGLGSLMSGRGFGASGHMGGLFFLSGILGLVFFVLQIAASFATRFFSWVGIMRMSIYGRLSAGLQFSKIWAMIRKDINGLLRIFGMVILLGLALGAVFLVILFVVVLFAMFASFVMSGSSGTGNNSAWGFALALGGMTFLFILVLGFFSMACCLFVEMLTARALGYWTRQFDVAAWRGQEDPMPFELRQVAYSPAPSAGQQPPYCQVSDAVQQPVAQPGPDAVQQPVAQPGRPAVQQPVAQLVVNAGSKPSVSPAPEKTAEAAIPDQGDQQAVVPSAPKESNKPHQE